MQQGANKRTGFVHGYRSHKAFAALSLTAILFLTGCGEFFTPVTTGNPTGSSTYVYVTNVGSGGSGGTLTGYTLTGGTLAAISGSPITLPGTPTSIVVAPNNAFLYVGTDTGVFLYTIGSGGALTEGNDATVIYLNATNPTVQSLAVDSTSSWLLISNQSSTELDALAIDPTTGIPPSVTPVATKLSNPTPVQMAISPANNNVVVALGAGGTNVFGFNASSSTPWGSEVSIKLFTGATTALSSTAANTVAFDTTSAYLMIGESLPTTSTTDTLRLIAVASLGADIAEYPTGKGPAAILPDASGDYVYVANKTDSTISGFSLSAGVLTALSDSPFTSSKAPIALSEDSTKTYVLAAGFGLNPDLYLYTFDATSLGTLDIASTTTTGSADPSQANAMALSH